MHRLHWGMAVQPAWLLRALWSGSFDASARVGSQGRNERETWETR